MGVRRKGKLQKAGTIQEGGCEVCQEEEGRREMPRKENVMDLKRKEWIYEEKQKGDARK